MNIRLEGRVQNEREKAYDHKSRRGEQKSGREKAYYHKSRVESRE
jgi:hypothetical protein